MTFQCIKTNEMDISQNDKMTFQCIKTNEMDISQNDSNIPNDISQLSDYDDLDTPPDHSSEKSNVASQEQKTPPRSNVTSPNFEISSDSSHITEQSETELTTETQKTIQSDSENTTRLERTHRLKNKEIFKKPIKSSQEFLPLEECVNCNRKFRSDVLIKHEIICRKHKINAPTTGKVQKKFDKTWHYLRGTPAEGLISSIRVAPMRDIKTKTMENTNDRNFSECSICKRRFNVEFLKRHQTNCKAPKKSIPRNEQTLKPICLTSDFVNKSSKPSRQEKMKPKTLTPVRPPRIPKTVSLNGGVFWSFQSCEIDVEEFLLGTPSTTEPVQNYKHCFGPFAKNCNKRKEKPPAKRNNVSGWLTISPLPVRRNR
eukprot:GHVL01043217.1.p1 GENE.GHVL01043217.1~~GHVL01043217.1.p1  ORF type:complete len:385 (+),score=70.18 GHVL01043217.1:45-1157(+)